MRAIFGFLIAFLLFPFSVLSQVSIATPGPAGAYTQNFNGAFLSSADYSLFDNAAANLGWYALSTSTNAVPNIFDAEAGADNAGEFNNYGAAGQPERALGSVASNTSGDLFYGLRVQNDTGIFCRSIKIQYTGEQWRAANNSAQTLAFSYQVSAGDITSLSAGTWTNFTALNFTTPNLGTGGAIDGNAAGNRTVIEQAIFVDIPIGGEIMLRWIDANDSGNDHGVSIDDVTVTLFVPSAAGVSISGRVMTKDGRGIANAILVLNGGNLEQPMIARSNAFGYYTLEDVPAGLTYILEVRSKQYTFAEPSMVLNPDDNITDANFIAIPPE